MNAKFAAKVILFDLDGTIVDSRDAYLEAARIAFRTLGLEQPSVKTALQIPKRLEQRLPINDIVAADTARFLNVYLKAFYTIAAIKTKPFPNINLALEALQQKSKLAIVTMRNVPRNEIEKELQKFGLAHYFTYTLTAQDTPKPKPSPEALLRALEVINAPVCDCIIVGDSVIDVLAGKAIGAKTAAVLSGLYTKQELVQFNPDIILENATQLPSYIS